MGDNSILTIASYLHKCIGGIAQLGERLVCNQEVIGSIPFTSTIFFCRQLHFSVQ